VLVSPDATVVLLLRTVARTGQVSSWLSCSVAGCG
jgi:hypothetical protein